MTADDFAVDAGWGHFGTGDAVMPGQGRTQDRPYTPEEQAAAGDASVLTVHPCPSVDSGLSRRFLGRFRPNPRRWR